MPCALAPPWPTWRASALAALMLIALLGFVAAAALEVPGVTHVDSVPLKGFWLLQTTEVRGLIGAAPQTVNVAAFAAVSVALSGCKLQDRRPLLAVALLLIPLASILNTEALKSILPGRTLVVAGYRLSTVPSPVGTRLPPSRWSYASCSPAPRDGADLSPDSASSMRSVSAIPCWL